MEIQVWNANPNVREDIGRAAVPNVVFITYCLEEADNGCDLHLLTLDWNAPAQVRDFTVCGEPVKEILMQGFKEDKEKEAPQRFIPPGSDCGKNLRLPFALFHIIRGLW